MIVKTIFTFFTFGIFFMSNKTQALDMKTTILERFLTGLRKSNKIDWEIQPESTYEIVIVRGFDEKSQYWIAIADPKKTRVEPVIAPGRTLVPVSTLVGTPCKAGVNGGYFTVGGSLSLAVQNKTIVGRDVKNIRRYDRIGNPARAVWIQTENRLQGFGWGTVINDTIYRYQAPVDAFATSPHPRENAVPWFPTFALGGGPMLIYNNQFTNSSEQEMFDNLNIVPEDPAPRTAIAYTRNELLLAITADGRISEARGLKISELTDLLFSLGAKSALNLDGGASTTFVVDGEIKNKLSRPPERSVVTGVCFFKRIKE